MLIVQKYGGTSVEGPERIHSVAQRIASLHGDGHRVVVVVSAMGQTTDELRDLARLISSDPPEREMDMLLTAGERISMALLSMALHDRGVPAISFTGSQSGIITDTAHGGARVLDVRPIRIGPELDRGKVVIVAGFQGVSREKEITTLGRGGSDTTAVALAWRLNADRCEILSDVDGVMTADPRIVPGCRRLDRLSWDQLHALSSRGAGVMHHAGVEFAREHSVDFRIASSFTDGPGTAIGHDPDPRALAVTGLRDDPTATVCLVGALPPDAEERARTVLKDAPLEASPGCLTARVSPDRFESAQAALHRLFVEEA